LRSTISSLHHPVIAWRRLFRSADPIITRWMASHAVLLIRLSLGIVFLWFGALKFFGGFSPAEALAGRTISQLTFGKVSPSISLPLLAAWESLIGLGLLTNVAPRLTLLFLYVQMLGTLTPLILFPRETFLVFPVIPTLEGQYIIKNVVLISAGIVIGATVRGGRIVPEPARKRT
jgi:uncharacterized membrane protein YphA (DoxX/SURF4 family)